MFVEVVHANGYYDRATDTHSNPMSKSGLLSDVHHVITDLALNGTADIMYLPNYGYAATSIADSPELLAKVQRSDPFLAGLGSQVCEKLSIYPDGAQIDAKYRNIRIKAEDELVANNDRVVVLGAYIGTSVLDKATALKRRHIKKQISIDPYLSLSISKLNAWRTDSRYIGIEDLAESVSDETRRKLRPRAY